MVYRVYRIYRGVVRGDMFYDIPVFNGAKGTKKYF